METNQIITIDGVEWRVTMINSSYACIEMVSNPKVSKMIRL